MIRHAVRPSRLSRASRSSRANTSFKRASIEANVENAYAQRQAIFETARLRMIFVAGVVALAFLGIGGRLVDLMITAHEDPELVKKTREIYAKIPPREDGRGEIHDRNGALLAYNIQTRKLTAKPSAMLDIAHDAERLAPHLPQYDAQALYEKLTGLRLDYVELSRKLTPNKQRDILKLGLPGVYLIDEKTRIYPQGDRFSHVLGYTDYNDDGVRGVEQKYNGRLKSKTDPLRLTLDSRLQNRVAPILEAAARTYQAKGGGALVMDIKSGEVLSLVSWPFYDPNRPPPADNPIMHNYMVDSRFELGSTFKILNTALFLESEGGTLEQKFDATKPLRIGRFMINDYHPQNRWLDVREVFIHSSNIGSALMAEQVGASAQKKFFERTRLLECQPLEVGRCVQPLVPKAWNRASAMTIAYGHGIAVTPINLVAAIRTILGDGAYRRPTLAASELLDNGLSSPKAIEISSVPQNPEANPQLTPVVSQNTVQTMREFMRANVLEGSGGRADVPGYLVGGKTGTAEKYNTLIKAYDPKLLVSSFVGAFPMNDPQYLIYALLDEPKGTAETQFKATGGWVAAPIVGQIVKAITSLYLIPPYVQEGPGIESAIQNQPKPDALLSSPKAQNP